MDGPVRRPERLADAIFATCANPRAIRPRRLSRCRSGACCWNIASGFLSSLLAALALRLVFYFRFPHVTGDSLIYGDIASNWLDHGIFGLTHAEGVRPTWIRLPGYPAFLALCFTLFGREHYHAVLLVQIALILPGASSSPTWRGGRCRSRPLNLHLRWRHFVPSRRTTRSLPWPKLSASSSRRSRSMPLSPDSCTSRMVRHRGKLGPCCGMAVSAGIQLRPDGGILLAAIGLFLLWRMWQRPAQRTQLFWAGALGAGDLTRAARSLDGSQLARVPPFRAAGSPLRQ